MKKLSLLLFCACLANGASAAGGKSGVKGAKTGAVLSAAPAAASVQTGSGGGGSAAMLGTGVIAERSLYTDPRHVPPMDPARDVSEQDCTKPVDLTRGNLKCK